ncbi:hypothetical protein [Nocardiopsis changdeensis]|uniref:hypothetical protein n=1 Tax=Nocardiopsis changdeensis TaxID=2831969 RepID=UPI003F458149
MATMTIWTITPMGGQRSPQYERDGQPADAHALRTFLDDTLPLSRSHPDRTADVPNRYLDRQVEIKVIGTKVSSSPPLEIGELRMIRLWAEHGAISGEAEAAERARRARIANALASRL